MATGSKIVKTTALTALNGNMLSAIFAGLVFLFSCLICERSVSILLYVSAFPAYLVVLALLSVFFLAPVFLGLVRFVWRLLFGAIDSPLAVFYYISNPKNYLKALKFIGLLFLKAVPMGLVFFTPIYVLRLLTNDSFYELFDISIPLWAANLDSVSLIVKTFAIVALIFYMLKFYIAPILFVADEDMDVQETLHMSTVISRKSALDFIYLFSSFAIWIILSFFIIPLVFTLPYMVAAYAVHVRFSVAEYNLHIKRSKSSIKGVFYEI